MGEHFIDLLYLHIPIKIHVSNVFSKQPLPCHSLNLFTMSAAHNKQHKEYTKDEDCKGIYEEVSFSLE